VNLFLLKVALKKLVAELKTTVRDKNNVFSPPLLRIFAKVLRVELLVLFFCGSAHAVLKLFNDNQHERVTVIEHFRIWQINQITLPPIINATGDSVTRLEIMPNKVMQRVP